MASTRRRAPWPAPQGSPCGEAGDLHQNLSVPPPRWMVEGDRFLAVVGEEGRVFSVQNSCMERVPWRGSRWPRPPAWCRRHTCGTRRRWGVPHFGIVAEDGVFDAHQLEDALDLAQVADGVAVEAAEEVDLLVRHALQRRHGAGLAVPEVLQHALHGVVVAGDVAADEGRGVGEGHVELGGNRAFSLEVLMKALRSSPMTSAMQVWRRRSSWACTWNMVWRGRQSCC